MEISLQGLESSAGVERRRLAGWLRRLVAYLCPEAASLGVRLVDDAEMQAWNRRYRGVDRPTDVLSFPGEESADGRHLGDLLISLDTARRQAEQAGLTLERELQELLLHGVLHCMGHDHERDQGQMDALELELRRRFVTGDEPGAASR